MIARVWRGVTSANDAAAYESMLKPELLPGISSAPGFITSYLLRHDRADEVEFVTIMLFDSLESIRKIGGPSYEKAIIPEERKRLLLRHDAGLNSLRSRSGVRSRTKERPRLIIWHYAAPIAKMGSAQSVACCRGVAYNHSRRKRFGFTSICVAPYRSIVQSHSSIMKLRATIVGLLLATLLLFVPAASAQDGLRGAVSQIEKTLPEAAGFGRGLAAADFDHDSRPDGAVLSKAGWLNGQRAFRIDVHVTSGRDATILFQSTEPELNILAIDVNRDGAPDIVVEQAFTHHRLQIYLNDGYGSFERAESDTFSVPDDSLPLWGPGTDPLNPPFALPPSTRGFEPGTVKAIATAHVDRSGSPQFWPEVLLNQCGARAPASSRAPPSCLKL